MGKGETACYEQFLLFPQCFQKVCFPEASKGVVVLEWVNNQTKKWTCPNPKNLQTIQIRFKSLWLPSVRQKIVGKGENAILKDNKKYVTKTNLSNRNMHTVLSFVTFCKLTLSQTSPGFYVSAAQVFWKHCGKRRNCSQRAISPFPAVFSTHLENFLQFSSNLKLLSEKSFSLEESKICCLVKG